MSIDVEARLRDALDSREVADIIGPLESLEVTLLARFLVARLVPADDNESRNRAAPPQSGPTGSTADLSPVGFERGPVPLVPAEDEGRLREALTQGGAARMLHAAAIGCVGARCDPDGNDRTLWHYEPADRLRAALTATPEPK